MTSMPRPEAHAELIREFETRELARNALIETVRFDQSPDVLRKLIVAKSKTDRSLIKHELHENGIESRYVESAPSERMRPDVSIVGYDTLHTIIESPFRDHMIDPSKTRRVYLFSPADTRPQRVRLLMDVFRYSFVQQFYAVEIRAKHTGPPGIPVPTFGAPKRGWDSDMACSGLGVDKSVHSSEVQVGREIAAVVCGQCTVRDSCLSAGLQVDASIAHIDERWGVWGGLTVFQRMRVATMRRRGLALEATTYVQRIWANGTRE